ncbi:MAG: aryl sulfotransferase [Deltaproteobacteria bacterium]|nr:aryl sulfotransferase [Deltaproteobacteria bacterium]
MHDQKITRHNQEIKNNFNIHGFVNRDITFSDPGYLLISRFSREHKVVVVELFRLRDFHSLHRWVPPISNIIKQGEQDETTDNLHLREAGFRVQHPLLLEDGSIVFSHGEGYLARIDKDSRLIWVNSHHFHHSIERGIDGNLIVGINYPPKDYPPEHRNDGYAIVSPEGEIMEIRSITKMLRDNGYADLVEGMNSINSKDPIHPNDLQPIFQDFHIYKRGDIALSMRTPSTIAVYRPQDNKIITLKSGPWLLQHDINILPNGRFSIFNNFTVSGKSNSNSPLSTVMIWDPVSGTIESPYEDILIQLDVFTDTSGRSRILSNGDVFIEETMSARILRVSPDKVRWEYVNSSEDNPKISGLLHWSRYYLPNEIPLDWLEEIP